MKFLINYKGDSEVVEANSAIEAALKFCKKRNLDYNEMDKGDIKVGKF